MFRCIGGPLDGKKRGYDTIPESYRMYNRADGGHDIPSAVWVYEEILTKPPEPAAPKVSKKRRARVKPLELHVLDVERVV